MQRKFTIIIAFLAWFAVVTQLVLMLKNTEESILKTLVSFLSFFTILTNTLVALLFTGRLLHIKITQKAGKLTAVTSYILIVGIVYQFFLRHLWSPTGLQWAVDELLHTLIPVLVTVYWYLFEEKSGIHYKQIPGWLIYPFVYFSYLLLRGALSHDYPYPFIDVSKLGVPKVLMNAMLILILFVVIQVALLVVRRRLPRKN